MSDQQRTEFSASDSALGYLYQCRYALFSALHRLRQEKSFIVSIETLDDVVFESNDAPLALLQTKHHLKQAANLTDASKDIWKTLRIWSEQISKGMLPVGSLFFLITTANIATGSAASKLTSTDRDEEYALNCLTQTARTSRNEENKQAYQIFLSLDQSQQKQLIEAITIFPNSPNISELDGLLKDALYFATRREFMNSFLIRLEGWWFRRAINHLTNTNIIPILSDELDSEIQNLREQFKSEALPVDDDVFNLEPDNNSYGDYPFVHQLQLIGIGFRRVVIAIRDYYRATEQRSRWVREDLLLVGEMDRYEKRLTEAWEVVFAQMCDQLGDDAVEDAKKRAAQEVYKWVENNVIPIRPDVRHEFICRGSYHILADKQVVGWHPNFLDRLKDLIERRNNA